MEVHLRGFILGNLVGELEDFLDKENAQEV